MSHESTDAKIARIDANVINVEKLLVALTSKVDRHEEAIQEHKNDRKWIVGLTTLFAGAGGHGMHKFLDWINKHTGG